MEIQTIVILVLTATNAMTAIWALYMDTRNEQLQGYIERRDRYTDSLEKELAQLKSRTWRT